MRAGEREIKKSKTKNKTLSKERNRGKLILKFTKEVEGPGKSEDCIVCTMVYSVEYVLRGAS